tara:strand:+ start:885 stop:1343 length:459 start_codon:yes stop_codon:yes gene_type:complete
MKQISFFHFLKLFVLLLLTYNIIVVSTLYAPVTKIKGFLWKLTPYSYKQILYYPNNFDQLPLLNKGNRLMLLNFLNKNIYKDFLDIDFWNFKQIIESIDQDNIKELEKSFYKAFILSKNNKKINTELREYFIKNYSKFSNEYKNKILKNFFN